MTSQPEPHQGWPGSADLDRGPVAPGFRSAGGPAQAGRGAGGLDAGNWVADQRSEQPRGPRRPGLRGIAFALVLAVGLAGLLGAAVGVAHRLLPRRFTAAQQRQIIGWEMERRWRVLPAGKIFPASVPYTVPAAALDGPDSLTLQAQRLAISPAESCSAAVLGPAAAVLDSHGCSTALRATYVDASGSMVATVVVAVLPAGTAASSVASVLASTATEPGGPAQTFSVAGTSAAGFGDGERQVSDVAGAGPYVIVSTAGFTDDRREQVTADDYVHAEMTSLAQGLVRSAELVLGARPRPPTCPGAPGC